MIASMESNAALIESIVREVIAQIRGADPRSPAPHGNANAEPPRVLPVPVQTIPAASGRDGSLGVFRNVDDAVAAANEAFERLRERTLEERGRAIREIRRIVIEQAEELGKAELDETKIGRLEHKIDKLRIIGERIPGVEYLRSEAASGDHGLTITEYGPFGTIGVITPVTHSLPTLAANAINMIAAGNTLVCNPHPSGAGIACEGARRFNAAIQRAIGIENLITIIEQPTLEAAQAIFDHRGIRILCVTGGPGLARAALASRKRAIVAGPGNPPVVVDDTADMDNAARSVVAGAAYDNNLLCIGEKQVFVIDSVFDRFAQALARHGAEALDVREVEQLTKIAFLPATEPAGQLSVNRKLLGQDAHVLATEIGKRLASGTVLLFGEVEGDHPFVQLEQMMPFIPLVRTRSVDEAVNLARESEHGYRHTSVIHSRDVRAMTQMGRALETTIFVKNGPCFAGLGIGGEGFCSFSIAGPTGEGPTNPLTFTRHRRCTMVDALRVV
jgi:acyl-CoA reductase-like NAD-dependent aldehyde dehydrogenase